MSSPHKAILSVAVTLLLPVVSLMAGRRSVSSASAPLVDSAAERPGQNAVDVAADSAATADTASHSAYMPPLPPDEMEEASFNLDYFFTEEPPQVDPEAWIDTAVVNPGTGKLRGHFITLTDDDYREVAEELGVETAAIKAVVDIEAGRGHKGFWAAGRPLINFDVSMYRKFAPRHGVSLAKVKKSHPEVFARPNVKRHGSYQSAQQARLDAACGIDSVSAIESTFWGMFQIGGFNWQKCGAKSAHEFMRLMSRSERDQLELFAQFIRHGGMLEAIQSKNWLRFALRYNGPKAKARGYHTRLAAAYKRHKALETKQGH